MTIIGSLGFYNHNESSCFLLLFNGHSMLQRSMSSFKLDKSPFDQPLAILRTLNWIFTYPCCSGQLSPILTLPSVLGSVLYNERQNNTMDVTMVAARSISMVSVKLRLTINMRVLYVYIEYGSCQNDCRF